MFDARAQIIGSALLILAVTLVEPFSLAKAGMALGFLCLFAIIANLRIGKMLGQGAISLPFAGPIALASPLAFINGWSFAAVATAYTTYWPLIVILVAKAYLSACMVSLLGQSLTQDEIIRGLARLRLPHIFITLFTFLLRFSDLFRQEIVVMRNAIASRAHSLRGLALTKLYGRLAGNLFVRAYERGEKVYAAMVSRGYTGVFPQSQSHDWNVADTLSLAMMITSALAILI